MADNTNIEWTDATWNPIRGCSRVSAGCQHCYAERVAARFDGPGQPYEGLIHPSTRGWNGQVKLVPEALQIPWRWTRGRRIFVNSMSDLFHEEVPFEFIAAVFFIMSVTTRHTYQVLTKRPARALEFFSWLMDYGDESGLASAVWPVGHEHARWLQGNAVYDAAHTIQAITALGWEPATKRRGGYDNCGPGWPLANVWLGVSVEDQAAADERIPLLLQCPAAVRWISAEPLLGPVDLTRVHGVPHNAPFDAIKRPTKAYGYVRCVQHATGHCLSDCEWRWPSLDWVVAGGESGPGARPMHPEWARTLRNQCAAAGVPFLFKQWGEWAPSRQFMPFTATERDEFGVALGPVAEHFVRGGKKRTGRELDGVTHDGFPEVRHA